MICLNLGVARLVVGVVAGLDLEDGEGEHDGHGVGHRDPPRDDLQYVILQFEFRAFLHFHRPAPHLLAAALDVVHVREQRRRDLAALARQVIPVH